MLLTCTEFLDEREYMVKEFHVAMGLEVNAQPTTETIKLRRKLLLEEMREVTDELDTIEMTITRGLPIDKAQWERLLKELCDLQYVLSGTIVALNGIDTGTFMDAYDLVHESNMSKLDDNGKPVKNDYGKVIKGPNYVAPDLGDLV